MKTLVIAPSIHRLGGITTVVMSHRDSLLWNAWGCIWIGTCPSRSAFWKILWVVGALCRFAWHLPSAKTVHIHIADGASVPRKKLFFYPAAWLKKKVILHLHAPSFHPEEAAERFRELRDMFQRADQVVALSESWAREIKNHIPLAKVAVVANAVARPDDVMDIADRRKVIFFAGKLELRKGYNHLLEAFARLSTRYPDWYLELAGDGAVEEAKLLARNLGIDHRVRVLGWVRRDRMLELMGSSKVFCLPSHAEGFPMSVLEALAQGCAVVTTPVGGLRDDLIDGQDVVFVAPGDSTALSEALERVIVSNDLQAKLSRRGRDLSASRYSRESSLEAMGKVYSKVWP